MGKLTPVDTGKVYEELSSLQMVYCKENEGDFLLRMVRLRVKRLRALLPDDLDLADGFSIVSLKSLADFVAETAAVYHLDDEAGLPIPAPFSERLAERLAWLIREFRPRRLDQDEDLDQDANKPETPAVEDQAPVEYLMNWREILDELKQKNDDEKRDRIRRLNNMHGGPIIFPGRGTQPTVDKAKLVAWWNGLEDRLRELEQQQTDRQATVADQVNYGKDGTVVPDIAGGVKKRRKDRKP